MIISFASKLFGNESTVKNSVFYPFIDDFLNLSDMFGSWLLLGMSLKSCLTMRSPCHTVGEEAVAFPRVQSFKN